MFWLIFMVTFWNDSLAAYQLGLHVCQNWSIGTFYLGWAKKYFLFCNVPPGACKKTYHGFWHPNSSSKTQVHIGTSSKPSNCNCYLLVFWQTGMPKQLTNFCTSWWMIKGASNSDSSLNASRSTQNIHLNVLGSKQSISSRGEKENEAEQYIIKEVRNQI